MVSWVVGRFLLFNVFLNIVVIYVLLLCRLVFLFGCSVCEILDVQRTKFCRFMRGKFCIEQSKHRALELNLADLKNGGCFPQEASFVLAS